MQNICAQVHHNNHNKVSTRRNLKLAHTIVVNSDTKNGDIAMASYKDHYLNGQPHARPRTRDTHFVSPVQSPPALQVVETHPKRSPGISRYAACYPCVSGRSHPTKPPTLIEAASLLVLDQSQCLLGTPGCCTRRGRIGGLELVSACELGQISLCGD